MVMDFQSFFRNDCQVINFKLLYSIKGFACFLIDYFHKSFHNEVLFAISTVFVFDLATAFLSHCSKTTSEFDLICLIVLTWEHHLLSELKIYLNPYFKCSSEFTVKLILDHQMPFHLDHWSILLWTRDYGEKPSSQRFFGFGHFPYLAFNGCLITLYCCQI